MAGGGLANGTMDELRKRAFDDYGESDDDLRKEDIMFPTDASHMGIFQKYLRQYRLDM